MKKFSCFILTLIMVFSAVFCVPVGAASGSRFVYSLSSDKSYYTIVGCDKNLKGKIEIPQKYKGKPVSAIGKEAFSYSKITAVKIGSNIKTIGEYAFAYSQNLKTITLPDKPMRISTSAFNGTVYYHDKSNWSSGVLYIGKHLISSDYDISENYRVKKGTVSIAEGTFYCFSKIKSVVLPDSITHIYKNTFFGCDSLKHIYIPEGVKSIGDSAFADCKKLKYVHLPSTLQTIESGAFRNSEVIYIPNNVNNIKKNALPNAKVIYGKKGSAAHSYAKANGIKFKSIAQHKHTAKTIKHSSASVFCCGISYKRCNVCCDIMKYSITPQKTPAKIKTITLENVYRGLGNDDIAISWKGVKGADLYRVYRKTEGAKNWSLLCTTDYTGYYDENVKNGKIYTYTVRAVNEAGVGAANTQGKKIKAISTPEVKSCKNVQNGVQINWKKVQYADKYYVYRDIGDAKIKLIKTINNGNTSTFTDTNVESGGNYFYCVIAGNGSYKSSDDISRTGIVWLSVPKLSSVKSTKNGVEFTWKKVKAADSYIVYRKEGTGKWKKLKKVVGNNIVSYVDSTAKKGKTYTYTVKASMSDYYTSDYNKTGLTVKDKY